MQTPDIGLGNLIYRRTQLSGSRPALTFEDKTLTYAEFGERVFKLASVLREGGVCRGDRVGYIGLNHPAFLETMYAANVLGAVFVPLNFRLTGHEVQFIANNAGIHTLVADNELRAIIDSEKTNLVCRRYLSAEDEAEGWEHYESLVSSSEALSEPESVEACDIAFIMYTSGTTGLPKGAMLTYGNLFWNGANIMGAENLLGTVSLTCAPLFHIGGLNVTTLNTFTAGAHVILHRQFDPALVLSDLQRYKVSCMFGAPAMFLFMSQMPEFADADLSSVEGFICGAAPVPESLIKVYADRDIKFCQGYGLTETAPMASLLTSDQCLNKLGSAGTAPLYTQLRIVDAHNTSLPAHERGEICIKGPNIMKGYWNRPEATREAIDEQGWFHSGDVGYLDEEGYLFICDRVKDMVISGGENVYPAEVEGVLYEHPAITEVAVIGLPDDKWGEAVTAVAALAEGASLTLEELREFGGDKLARYKLPLHLKIVPALPRNPAGKVLKFKLRDEYSG